MYLSDDGKEEEGNSKHTLYRSLMFIVQRVFLSLHPSHLCCTSSHPFLIHRLIRVDRTGKTRLQMILHHTSFMLSNVGRERSQGPRIDGFLIARVRRLHGRIAQLVDSAVVHFFLRRAICVALDSSLWVLRELSRSNGTGERACATAGRRVDRSTVCRLIWQRQGELVSDFPFFFGESSSGIVEIRKWNVG